MKEVVIKEEINTKRRSVHITNFTQNQLDDLDVLKFLKTAQKRNQEFTKKNDHMLKSKRHVSI